MILICLVVRPLPGYAARMRIPRARLLAAAIASVAVARSAPAQNPDNWVRISAQGVAAVTRVDPVPGGSSLAETRVEEDVIMVQAGAFENRLRFQGALDLEGLTMPDGALTLGAWGEGFNDGATPTPTPMSSSCHGSSR